MANRERLAKFQKALRLGMPDGMIERSDLASAERTPARRTSTGRTCGGRLWSRQVWGTNLENKKVISLEGGVIDKLRRGVPAVGGNMVRR
jgi:hypothetical protein